MRKNTVCWIALALPWVLTAIGCGTDNANPGLGYIAQDGQVTVDTGVTDDDPIDTDNDGLADTTEDKNGNGKVDPGETDPKAADTDGDGLTDGAEVFAYGTDPTKADTDGDGLSDGLEVGKAGDADPSTVTDPLKPDTDGDGMLDGAEDANKNGKVDPGESNPGGADPGTACGAGCDDGNPCTKGECLAGKCNQVPVDGACEAGTCVGGKCVPTACQADKDWVLVPAGKGWMPKVIMQEAVLNAGESYDALLDGLAPGHEIYGWFSPTTQEGQTVAPGATCGAEKCFAKVVWGGGFATGSFLFLRIPVRVKDFRKCVQAGACAYVDEWVKAALATPQCADKTCAESGLTSLALNGTFPVGNWNDCDTKQYCNPVAEPMSNAIIPCKSAFTTRPIACGTPGFPLWRHNAGMKREGHPMNVASGMMAKAYCEWLGGKVVAGGQLAGAQVSYKAILGGCTKEDCAAEKLAYMKDEFLSPSAEPGGAVLWQGLSLGKSLVDGQAGFWEAFVEAPLWGADTISLDQISAKALPSGVLVDPFHASWYCYKDLPAECQ